MLVYNKDDIIQNAIDLYLETWKDKPKPYKCNEYLAKKKNIPIDQTALRYTTPQPFVFLSDNNQIRYNKRKLTMLIYLISNLSANKAAIIACNEIFFNYEFMHKKILNSEVTVFMDEVRRITNLFPYLNDEELKGRVMQAQVLLLSLFLCLYTIFENPSSFALHINSHVLRFYKNEYFQRFIDELDEKSKFVCALVAPYQYLPSIGGGAFISIDKHKAPITCSCFDYEYMLTMSDKINLFYLRNVETLGEIPIPNGQIELFTQARAYLEQRPTFYGKRPIFSQIKGGCLVMSSKTIHHIYYNETILFTKTYKKETLENIFILNQKNFLVQFEDNNYFEICNMNTGELIKKCEFNSKVKLIKSTINMSLMDDFKLTKTIHLLVCLERGEIHKFSVNQSDDSNIVKFIYKIEPSGYECVSSNFMKIVDNLQFYTYAVTFENGSICVFEEDKSNSLLKNVKYIKAINAENYGGGSFKSFRYTITDFFENGLLLLAENRNLYLWLIKENKLRLIPGNYDNGRYDGKSLVIGSAKGLLYFIQVSLNMFDQNTYKAYKKLEVEAHHDEITYLEYSGKLISSIFLSKINCVISLIYRGYARYCF